MITRYKSTYEHNHGVQKVLFICERNACQSIMAESILNDIGLGQYESYSAGVSPDSVPDDEALSLLQKQHHGTIGLHCKHWNTFTEGGDVSFDYIISLGQKYRDIHSHWQGVPMAVTWDLPDPYILRKHTSNTSRAYAKTYQFIRQRLEVFINLPVRQLSHRALHMKLRELGQGFSPTTHS